MNSDHIFKVGEQVKIKGLSLKGEIESISPKNGKCKVRINDKSIVTTIDKLSQIVEKKSGKNKKSASRSKISYSDKKFSVDLHGKTRDEAKELIIGALDKAIINGCSQIEIIHGHGSGILKALVMDFVRTNSYIKSYKVPEYNTGMVILYL